MYVQIFTNRAKNFDIFHRSGFEKVSYAWRLYYDHSVTLADGVTTTSNPTNHIIHRRRQYRYIDYYILYLYNNDSPQQYLILNGTKKNYDIMQN